MSLTFFISANKHKNAMLKFASNIFQKIYGLITRAAYFIKEVILAYLSRNSKIKILVSSSYWVKNIQFGFWFTPYDVKFGKIESEDISQFDIIVPTTNKEAFYLHEISLTSKLSLPVPSKKTVSICHNKEKFNEMLIDNDFGNLIPKIGVQNQYPYILKKKIDAWGRHTYVIDNEEKEKEFLDLIESKEYYCQELILGKQEFATHIIFSSGQIIWSLNIKYFFSEETPIKGKSKLITKAICDCPYLDIFNSILKLIDYQGLCCFNYKVKDNVPLIIELNPRFGGSLAPFAFSFIRHLE